MRREEHVENIGVETGKTWGSGGGGGGESVASKMEWGGQADKGEIMEDFNYLIGVRVLLLLQRAENSSTCCQIFLWVSLCKIPPELMLCWIG